MEKMDWIIYLLTGPLLVLCGIVFKVFPAKRINNFYGYRTPRSKRNQETWNAANQFANNLMLWMFIALAIIELPLFYLLGSEIAALVSCGLMVVLVVMLIILTENFLKRKFD